MLGQPLGFVAEEHNNVARSDLQLLTETAHQGEAFVGHGLRLRMPSAGRTQQCAKERTLEVTAMVLARHSQR